MSIPPAIEVGLAQPHEVEDIVAVLAEARAWMVAKGTPAWAVTVPSAPYVAPAITASQFVTAKIEGRIVGVCTLSRADPEYWPEDQGGYAAYMHRIAIRRTFAGGVLTRPLVAWCAARAREWGCAALRLDCHPTLVGVYESLGFILVDIRDMSAKGRGPMMVARLERPIAVS